MPISMLARVPQGKASPLPVMTTTATTTRIPAVVIRLISGWLNCALGAVGVGDTHGGGISQTLKDGEYIFTGISRGGLLVQSQGNELVVTLTRLGQFHG
jgi:hypothetical protein